MVQPNIEPHRVTRPIQLLAAWLVGLVLVNAAFLASAAAIEDPSWVTALLVVASILNVPLFLLAIFLLQTKYRPEMQEDAYYSEYLQANVSARTSTQLEADLGELRSAVFESDARTLGLVEELQSLVGNFAKQASVATAVSTPATETLVGELGTDLAQFREKTISTKREALWDRYYIQVNELLPSFLGLKGDLMEAGIPVDGTFGSTSKSPEAPTLSVVTFGYNVDIGAIAAILPLVFGHGFDYVSFVGPDEREEQDNIYIGSLIYKYWHKKWHSDKLFARLDDEIVAEAERSDGSQEDFIALMKKKSQSQEDFIALMKKLGKHADAD